MAKRCTVLGLMTVLGWGFAGCSGDDVSLSGDADDVPVDAEDGADVAEADVAPDADADAESDGDATETSDVPCTLDEECADELFCNGEELCVDGECVAGDDPCDDGVECTIESCDEARARCTSIPDDASCEDGEVCNGEEFCLPGSGCEPGIPLDCTDDSPCTIDTCDEAVGGCFYAERDLDRDGHMTTELGCDELGGDDCNDDDGTIFPGAGEVCDDGIDNDCDGLIDYDETDCRPVNDTCGGAVALTDGVTTHGSLLGLAADYTIGCFPTYPSSGRDAVFSLTITETLDVIVDVVFEGYARGGFELRSACADATTAMGCGAAPTTTSLRRNSLEPGTYFVIVTANEEAEFTITFTTDGPTPIPPNDVCSGAIDVPAGGGTVTGTLFDTGDDYVPSCRTGARSDVFYRLVLTEPHRVILSASLTPTSWNTYVALMGECGVPASEIACGGGTTATLTRNFLDAGTYYIVVDGDPADPFTLEVTLEPPIYPPANDTCTGAEDVPAAGGVLPGTLVSASDDYTPTCATVGTYPDVFYRLVLTEPHRVIISAGLTPTSYRTYVSLMSECGVSTSEIACVGGSTATLTRNFLDAGTYYIAVDGDAENPTTLSVTLEPPIPPPPNDLCSGAVDVSAGGSFVGTFAEAYRDYPVSCLVDSYAVDVVYTFTTTAPQDLTLAASGIGWTGAIAMSLRIDCASADSEIRCRSGNPSVLTARSVPAGTYSVILSSRTGAGRFLLEVDIAPPTPLPPGDVCADAVDVSAGGSFAGTTVACEDDYAPTCGATRVWVDSVYRLTLATPQDVTLGLTSAAANSYLDFRSGSCGTGTTSLRCIYGASPLSIFTRNVPAGDYWILVDTETEAATTLDVTLAPPTSACDGARTITVDYSAGSTFTDTVSGTTAGRPNDFVPGCLTFSTAPDEPISLVVPVRSAVSVVMDTTSFDGSLHLRSACDDASSEVGCNDDCGSTRRSCVPSSGTMTMEAGTYTIIADGYSTGSGTYTVTVTATAL